MNVTHFIFASAVEVVVNVNVKRRWCARSCACNTLPPSVTLTLLAFCTPTHSLSFPLPSPSLSPTAWVSSLGHSIAFARQPRSSFALCWAPIRVSNQHATVGTWISLALSSFNLVSCLPIQRRKVLSKRNFVLTGPPLCISNMFRPCRRDSDDGNHDLSHSK